ncbi:MAG: hypothetical protein MK102_09040 [Fuerstiella sp.]|nr:hypothetical protein [Fuerstiella sp.]
MRSWSRCGTSLRCPDLGVGFGATLFHLFHDDSCADRILRIGRRYSASLITTGRLVYFLSDDGDTKIVRVRTAFELVANNPLDELCSASPAVSGGQILIRGDKHLFCIGKSDGNGD